ncbi:MAG: helix-turn-helix domain-containing protein [Bacteroidota bacterium]|nr:helix-turn-helix domain-containing protein [Bacteroidota bacterium]
MKIHTINQFSNSTQKIIRVSDELVTLSDLQDFRAQLLKDMKMLLAGNNSVPTKPWLKSNEVRKLLNISSGTLQTLRSNGTLPFNKVGGIIYYSYEDIQNMIENNPSMKMIK